MIWVGQFAGDAENHLMIKNLMGCVIGQMSGIPFAILIAVQEIVKTVGTVGLINETLARNTIGKVLNSKKGGGNIKSKEQRREKNQLTRFIGCKIDPSEGLEKINMTPVEVFNDVMHYRWDRQHLPNYMGYVDFSPFP